MTPLMRVNLRIPRSRPLLLPFFVIAALAMLAMSGGTRVALAGEIFPVMIEGGEQGSERRTEPSSGPTGFCCYDIYSEVNDGECEEGWTEAGCKGSDIDGLGKLWNGDKPLCDFMCGKQYKFYYCDPETYTCSDDIDDRPAYSSTTPANIRRGYKEAESCIAECVPPTVELKAFSLCSEKDHNDNSIPPTRYGGFYIDFPTDVERRSNYNSTPDKLRYEDMHSGTRITFTVDACLKPVGFLSEPFNIGHLSWIVSYIPGSSIIEFSASDLDTSIADPSYATKELNNRISELTQYDRSSSERILFTMPVDYDCPPGDTIFSEATIALQTGESFRTIRSEEASFTIKGCGCSVCKECETAEGGKCDFSTCIFEDPYSRYCKWMSLDDVQGTGYCVPDSENEQCDYFYACCQKKPSVSNLRIGSLTAQMGGLFSDEVIDYSYNDNRYIQAARQNTYKTDFFDEAQTCENMVASTAEDEVYLAADMSSEDAVNLQDRINTIKNYCEKPRSNDLWCDRRLSPDQVTACRVRDPSGEGQNPFVGTVMFVPPFFSANPTDSDGVSNFPIGEDSGMECEPYCESQRNMGVCCRRPRDGCVTMSVDECNPQGILLPFTDVSDEWHSTMCSSWEDAGDCIRSSGQ
ncbi:hypothetical protein A3H22_04310 [Candidatus Peribacteria bacterium RIFCSPLOWO2_12_FULL_55_15]|nr:MAG: hypothetical protein A3H22_04310 [Candidatus Peribacteria bacterium RIFCSPLOWO2_12_FULL_55_15]